MLSRFILPACAAMLFAGTPAFASPTDSSVNPSVSSDSATPDAAVPSVSGAPAVPKSPVVGPVLDDTPAESPSALERDRLNSAVFASPQGKSNATTDGAEFRLPLRDERFRLFDEDWRYRVDSRDNDWRYLVSPRDERSRSFGDDWRYRVNPRDELHGPLATRRQETVDRIGDMISPGFGRVEFDSGRNHIRIDYLYSRKCKLRGAGICFRMTF